MVGDFELTHKLINENLMSIKKKSTNVIAFGIVLLAAWVVTSAQAASEMSAKRIDSSTTHTRGPGSKSHLFHVGNTTVEYFSVGKGETVVLLPGGSLSVNYLANLARSLDASGYRAVRINPRGAGASARHGAGRDPTHFGRRCRRCDQTIRRRSGVPGMHSATVWRGCSPPTTPS